MDEASAEPSTIRGRLDEFYRRLGLLPKPMTADEALKQINDTLDEVEDALSGIPKQSPAPSPSVSDGRMYGPLPDFVLRRNNGSILALTRGHRIEIACDGGFKIVHKATGETEFQK